MSQNKTNFNILIVDDNPVSADLLRCYLASESYNISRVGSGEKALGRIHRFQPDVILLDVMMPPGIDGYETCRRLKSDRNTASIPVIFVTARIAPEDISQGFAVGGSDYIAKPIQPAEVLARVAYQLKLTQQLKMERELVLKSQKMSSLGGFVSSIAHEISTPLGTLNTALSYTIDEADSLQKSFDAKTLKPNQLASFLQNLREALHISQTNIHSASQILHSFKLVAVDQCHYTVSKFNLREYIDNVLLSLKPNLKQTEHIVHSDIPADIEISSFPGAISQIVTNLINNSLRHAYPNEQPGHIHLSASEAEGWATLIYQDDGQGIPPAVLDKVFEPYYTTNAKKGGTGLGMSIVKRLVEQDLEGSVNIDSQVGQGIKVTIHFPCEKHSEPTQSA